MANPTVASPSKTLDNEGLQIACDGIRINGAVALGGQQSHIADLAAAALNTTNTYTDADVNAALDLIIDKVNALLAALEDAGILADS